MTRFNYKDMALMYFATTGYGKSKHIEEVNERLYDENQQLKQRINKAIKYIESLNYDDYGTGYYDIAENHYDELLEILKGE